MSELSVLKRRVTALLPLGDIITDHTIEILNPTHKIATLSSDGKLNIEMNVKMGKGYVPAERNKSQDQSIGSIPIDAVFTPIRRVSYRVINTRVGQRTDYDKLIMEIWTNGSVLPEDALAYAAKILKEQMNVFINFEEEPEPAEVEKEETEEDINEIFTEQLTSLNFQFVRQIA